MGGFERERTLRYISNCPSGSPAARRGAEARTGPRTSPPGMTTSEYARARTHNSGTSTSTSARPPGRHHGLSGSGKSSLAFDTLYAEGQAGYVESLSAYARQFLSSWKSRTWT